MTRRMRYSACVAAMLEVWRPTGVPCGPVLKTFNVLLSLTLLTGMPPSAWLQGQKSGCSRTSHSSEWTLAKSLDSLTLVTSSWMEMRRSELRQQARFSCSNKVSKYRLARYDK